MAAICCLERRREVSSGLSIVWSAATRRRRSRRRSFDWDIHGGTCRAIVRRWTDITDRNSSFDTKTRPLALSSAIEGATSGSDGNAIGSDQQESTTTATSSMESKGVSGFALTQSASGFNTPLVPSACAVHPNLSLMCVAYGSRWPRPRAPSSQEGAAESYGLQGIDAVTRMDFDALTSDDDQFATTSKRIRSFRQTRSGCSAQTSVLDVPRGALESLRALRHQR